MLRVTDPAAFPETLRGCVAALGNFDGVHRGHQIVIGAALDQAKRMGVPAVVITFEPHPRELFRPDDPPFRLSTPAGKTRALAKLGLAATVTLTFDAALSHLTPEAFIADLLQGAFGLSHVVIGYDFRFGHKRAGDATTLARMGEAAGFGLTVVSQAGDDSGGVFSSSRVRQHLRDGDPSAARAVLGRPWEIEGTVIKGDQRGRTLGFPTANVALGALLRPAYGVYAVQCAIVPADDDGTANDADTATAPEWHPAVANLGVRPMWQTEEPMLEAHLLDFAGDLYGRTLRCRLIDYLRGEERFDGIDPLIAQMRRDSDRARALLEGTGE